MSMVKERDMTIGRKILEELKEYHVDVFDVKMFKRIYYLRFSEKHTDNLWPLNFLKGGIEELLSYFKEVEVDEEGVCRIV